MPSNKMPHLLINLMKGVISLAVFFHKMIKRRNFKRNENEGDDNKEDAVK